MITGYILSGILIFSFLISMVLIFLFYFTGVLKFSNPQYLYFLIINLIFLFVFYIKDLKKKKFLANFGNEKLREKIIKNPDRGFLFSSRIALIFGFTLFTMALAGPQMGIREEKILRKGVDLVFCLDLSKSMDAEDVTPSRLKRSILEFSNFLSKVENHRVGLVVFAGDAYIQCPLTLDYDALKIFFEILDTNLVPKPGTNIGKGIKKGMETFIDKEKKGKYIILLTDGEDHFGEALKAAEEAKKENIVIYAIGIGSQRGSVIPEKDERGNLKGYKKNREGKVVTSRLGEELLQKIALTTGGKYYYSKTGNLALENILKDIEKEEKKELGYTKVTQFEARVNYLLLPALILLSYHFFAQSIGRVK